MAVGRISGPLLKSDLVRNGVDLAFETDLLYLDVNNNRIGVKTDSPEYELDVLGTTRTIDLNVTNRAKLADVTIEGNTISTANPYLNLATLDTVISLNKLRIDSIDIEGNAITTNDSNADLELSANGTGSVNVLSDLNVDGNIFATGNITADGNITIGDQDTDSVTFNAEIASDIIPDSDRTYNLGSDPTQGGAEWADLYVNRIFASSINSEDATISGIDLTLRQGNTFFVAENGDDDNSGDHILDPFASIKFALSQASAGDTIQIYPGQYSEEFPLTVPTGVTVKGYGIRSVFIEPTASTNTNDAFLLNGETSIEDLTLGNFYYDSNADSGYGFRYAPNFNVTSRSPYLRNITVITEGTSVAQGTNSSDDPRGFNDGDAGKGAYLDGSLALTTSKEASCLFNSLTFITPGVDAVTLTNGVRVEWLNCFSYFANRSIFAIDGTSGLKSEGKTALRVDEILGSFNIGETIEYYDIDGTTLLESGEIIDIDSSGKIFLSGKKEGFETADERSGKPIAANGDASLSTDEQKFGTASLELDGTGDYASITAQDDFGFETGDFTVEGWVYPTTSSGVSRIFDFRAGQINDNALSMNLDGLVPEVYINGAYRITGSSSLTVNSWNHLAYVRSETTGTLYLNGQSVGSWSDTVDYGTVKPLVIGALFNGAQSFFQGYIDDIRIIKGDAVVPPSGGPVTSALVTQETVLLARFDGENNSTDFVDDVVYDQDIRFSGGASARRITLTDFTDFGAEVRLISSAAVYGNFGLVGDGQGVIMYAIGQNLAYIGNGKEVTNDPETVIQGNEVIQLNGAKIRYESVDHKGDFRVGDLFHVNQEDGTVDFSVSDFTINTTDAVTFVTDGNTTTINGEKIETGNWRISDSTVETLSGDANLQSGSNQINVNSNLNVNGSLDVTGNVTIGGNITIGDEETDTIEIVAGIDSDITPKIDSAYSLGTNNKAWKNLFVNQVNLDDIVIRDNFIETTLSNSDLEFRANGTGEIYIPVNDVQIDKNLTVNQVTNLTDANINGDINQTGDTVQSGNYEITGSFSNSNILIDDNFITTTESNSDLELRANGTGNITVPENDVVIEKDLTVVGTTNFADIDITGDINQIGDVNQTGNISLTGDLDIIGDISVSGTSQFENIKINDNFITTTESNSDLELRATEFGEIILPDNDVIITNDLSVSGIISVQSINSDGTISADSFSTGNIFIDDNFITTTESNSDLELRANGTGNITVPENDVVIEQTLSVNSLTSLRDVFVDGNITHVGNTTQTGNFNLTGNLDVSGEVKIGASSIQFEDIEISGNSIGTTESNSDLELRANGTGVISIPTNNVVITNDMSVTGLLTVGSIAADGSISADSFSTGNILIDDNFITTTESNSDLELRANGTGSVVIDSFDFNETTISSSDDFNLTPGSGLLKINATGALKLPAGTTLNRPVALSGQLRYNTDLNRFEGFNGTSWINLKGVEDLDGDTKVTAELTEGANDGVIRFDVQGSTVVTIDDTELSAPRIDVDNIQIDGNTISTKTVNTDLQLSANGTGSVKFDNLAFRESTITNTVLDSVTEIESSGNGYVKFSGTYGLVIPTGASGERPPLDFTEVGQMRFNTDDSRVEIWDGQNWVSVAGSSAGITRNDAEEIALSTVLVLG